MTPEGKLQLKFKNAVKKVGGYTCKFVSPAHRGRTDQLAWVLNGITVYVEIKDGDKKLSPLQEVFKRDCERFGMPWECIRYEEDIDWFIKKYFTKYIWVEGYSAMNERFNEHRSKVIAEAWLKGDLK